MLVMLASGCADFVRGEYWASEDESGDATGVDGMYGYADDVHALLDSGCERCHAPANSAGNTAFLILSDDVDASYASTVAFIDPDDPPASRLLAKTAGTGHGGGVVFDDRSPEYALILAWIEQGAAP
jgi:hypothetical protein